MKKTLCIILTVFLIFCSLVSCGNASSSNSANMTGAETTETAKSEAPQNTETLNIWDGTVASSFEKGNGTEESPYEIAKASQLAFLAKEINSGKDYAGKHFFLTCDLDLNNIEWTPIGNGINSFQGSFDGNNKTIQNLKASNGATFKYKYPSGKETSYYALGLFATIENATIKNILIDGAEVRAYISKAVTSAHVGVLCGSLRTFNGSSNISNIKIKNSKIITDFEEEIRPMHLIIGGLIGHSYSTENTITNISRIETDTEISIENDYSSENDVGSVLGYAVSHDSTFNIENCASYMYLKTNEGYTLDNFFGMIGTSQASYKPFSMTNVFTKITINKIKDDFHGYPAYTANAILGDSYYYAFKDQPSAIGYKFENVFGCVEQVDEATGEKLISTELYKLPAGPDFAQINCQVCESLPENHGFDTTIWDLSDLSKPKLKKQ